MFFSPEEAPIGTVVTFWPWSSARYRWMAATNGLTTFVSVVLFSVAVFCRFVTTAVLCLALQTL